MRVLGPTSPNSHGMAGAERTEYTRACLESAARLYDDADVKLDHRDRNSSSAERPVSTKFGKLRAPRCEGGALVADLHYLKSHPLAESVCEDVERGLGLYGLSHDAQGKGEVRNGVFVVEQLTEVRSVDLVDKPATNRNLWESRETPMKGTLNGLLESFMRRSPSKAKRRIAFDLRESDMMGAPVKGVQEDGDGGAGAPATLGDMPADIPADDAPPADHVQALKDGFKAALMALIDDDTLDGATLAKRIKELIDAREKLTSEKEAPVPTEEAVEDEGAAKEKDKKDEDAKATKESKAVAPAAPGTTPLTESDRRDLLALREEKKVRELCESVEFKPSGPQFKALVAITESDRRPLINDLKKLANAPRAGSIHNAPAAETGVAPVHGTPAYVEALARLGRTPNAGANGAA